MNSNVRGSGATPNGLDTGLGRAPSQGSVPAPVQGWGSDLLGRQVRPSLGHSPSPDGTYCLGCMEDLTNEWTASFPCGDLRPRCEFCGNAGSIFHTVGGETFLVCGACWGGR
jgi:hypothetical protein